MRLASPKSQVVLEYVTMAVLVLSAIFLMGPYAIRSINAYFKFSEEAMKDSAGEVFSQESLLPNATPGGCSVGPWEHPTCGISECEVYQRLETRDVDPVGCATDKQCVPDTRCCPDYSMSCGGSGTDEINGAPTSPPKTTSCDFDIIHRLWREDCGTYSVTYSCQQDLMCGVNCGTIGANAHWCPETLIGEKAQLIPVTYIASTNTCPTSASGQKCVAQCIPGFTVNGTGTGCECLTNILLNNSFESPSIPWGTWLLVGSVDNWTTSFGCGIEIQNHITCDPSGGLGDQFIELDSTCSSGMYQDVITNPGSTYTLELYYSPRSDNPNPNDNAIGIYWEGSPVTQLNATSTPPLCPWTRYQYVLTSTGTPSRLEFRDEGVSNAFGGYLDGVSLRSSGCP